jgi:hypothetical protein
MGLDYGMNPKLEELRVMSWKILVLFTSSRLTESTHSYQYSVEYRHTHIHFNKNSVRILIHTNM